VSAARVTRLLRQGWLLESCGKYGGVVSFLTLGVGWTGGGGSGISYDGSLFIRVTLLSEYKSMILRGWSLVPLPLTRYLLDGASDGEGMTRGGSLVQQAFIGLV